MSQVRFRASSIASAFDCWMRWEAIHLRGMFQRGTPPAAIGTAVHAGAAVYDNSRMIGSSLSVDDAAGAVVDSIWNPDQEIDWAGEDKGNAEKTALSVYALYCGEIAQQFRFQAVEMRLNDLSIDMGDGLTIILTGTLDRVYEGIAGRGINDIKTGKMAVNGNGAAKVAGHGAQLGAYEILCEQTTGLPVTEPAKVTGLKTAGDPAAGIGEISNAREILLGKDSEPGLLDMAGHVFRSGMFPPNPRSILCSAKYCPLHPCKYCEK